MKKFDAKNITLKSLWQLFIVVAIPFITVTGATVIPYTLRLPCIYAVSISFLLIFLLSDIKLKFNAVSVAAFFLLSYIGISIAYSYDSSSTVQLFLLYLCAFSLLFIDLPDNYYDKLLTITYVICSVIAFSILLSAVVENCMMKYFWFIVNPTHTAQVTNAINNELAIGAYSGFAREKAEAAYIMNVGIAILFSRYFSFGKLEKKDIFMLLVFLAALMLTGKRTLLIIAILAFAIFMVISNVKSKVFKTASIILIALCFAFIVIMFIPKVANVFDRFMDQENMTSFGSRDALWKYITMMIAQFPLFGAGFGSYNQFAYDNGLRVGGSKWMFNGHNCYLQVFGELGIVGSAIFAAFVILAFIFTIKSIKKFKNNPNEAKLCYYSLYIQILIIIYSATGNPTYSRQIIFIWFFSIGMMLHVNRKNNSDIKILKNAKIHERQYL